MGHGQRSKTWVLGGSSFWAMRGVRRWKPPNRGTAVKIEESTVTPKQVSLRFISGAIRFDRSPIVSVSVVYQTAAFADSMGKMAHLLQRPGPYNYRRGGPFPLFHPPPAGNHF